MRFYPCQDPDSDYKACILAWLHFHKEGTNTA